MPILPQHMCECVSLHVHTCAVNNVHIYPQAKEGPQKYKAQEFTREKYRINVEIKDFFFQSLYLSQVLFGKCHGKIKK